MLVRDKFDRLSWPVRFVGGPRDGQQMAQWEAVVNGPPAGYRWQEVRNYALPQCSENVLMPA